MIREWVTVVSWRNGVATLLSEAKTSCSRCSARHGCGSAMLNKLAMKNAHIIQIASDKPLQTGQRIELGIKESSLLGSALLVYMMPILGLLLFSGLFQNLYHSDLAAAAGAMLGGTGGFVVTKGFSTLIGRQKSFQPVILKIALPVESTCPEREN